MVLEDLKGGLGTLDRRRTSPLFIINLKPCLFPSEEIEEVLSCYSAEGEILLITPGEATREPTPNLLIIAPCSL